MKPHIFIVSAILLLAGCSNQNGFGYQGSGGGQMGYNNSANMGANSGQIGAAGGAAGNANNIDYIEENIGDTVLFPVDQHYLTPAAMQILDRQAQWMISASNPILIEGHADEQGTREYNLALGARRAASVRDYLVQKGVPRSRIDVVSYGKERPLAICSDETCWSKNRRAVTVVK